MGNCVRCGASSGDVALCRDCVTALRIRLGDVVGILPTNTTNGNGKSRPEHRTILFGDLEVTLARQDQLADPRADNGGGSGTPLVFRPHVTETVWVLHQVLSVWVRELGGDPEGMSPRWGALWMLANLDRVQKSPDAAQIMDEVVDCVEQARRALDHPDDHRIFLGRCEHNGCRNEVYGVAWLSRAVCETCGAEHKIEERREWLKGRAEDHPASAPVVAGFLRLIGVKCTAEQVRGFAHRGRLVPVDFDDRGRPRYLVDDVLAALRDRYVRRTSNV